MKNEPIIVTHAPNRAKILGAVLCMASTFGCIAGATAQSLPVTIPSIIVFFAGLGMFVVGRLRE